MQKQLSRSICRSGCGLHWAEGCTSSIVFDSWRQCTLMGIGRTHCRHLANTNEPSVCGGDAFYVKLLWPLVTFGHAHLGSRRDSWALQAEYCIVGIPHNTVIYFIDRTCYGQPIYTRTHQEMRQRTWTFTQCARKLPEFAEITQNNAITPFKVIQGHRFWYQSKAHIRFPISD